MKIGNLILVTGRRGVEAVRSTGKYKIRVEITWKYQGNAAGMPDDVTSTLMEDVQDAMSKTFDKDPIAVMTGVYTGDGERNWIFYTTSVHIFEKKINEALAPFDLLPISIYTENDADWNEYDEMREATEIDTSDE
jgi:Family of unknown function (DUF695)